MIDGIEITVPAPHARELGERVWDWASRNLFWLLREDPGALDWLDASLPEITRSAPALTSGGRIFASKGTARADEATARRAERWLALSALSLRPGLDELLARYGARLGPRTPALSDLLATCGEEDASLARGIATTPNLLLVPSGPGEPAPPTRFACVFHIDEWPLTPQMEGILGVDPKVRDCVCWIQPAGPDTPSVFAAIPEIDIPGADARGMFALLSRFTPLIWQKPLAWLGDAPSMKRAFHASASRSEVEGFFTSTGFRLLTVAEVLGMHRTWSSIRHARMARVGHDAEPWVYPELWTEAFPPRRSAPERKALRAMARADQGIFRRASFARTDPQDGFAIVRDALVQAGMKRPEVFAAMVPMLTSWMHGGSWLWHLVTAIRSEPAVCKALRQAGFDRCHIVHLAQLLAAELHGSSIAVPLLHMDCADIATPEDLDPDAAAVVQAGFPILGTRFAIHLHRCASSAGALTGELVLVRWNDEEKIDGLGGRPATLLTAEQRQSPRAAATLQARLRALGGLSRADFDALFDDSQEDPFQPFQASASPTLAKLLGELFPIRRTDGSTLSLRRFEETPEGLFATATLTAHDESGSVMSVREWGRCKILTPTELKIRTARGALRRKIEHWKATPEEELWST